MKHYKSFSGFLAVSAFFVLAPHQAMACYCATKAGGGFVCETHCTPQEIEAKLGPNHGPVEQTQAGLTADNLGGAGAGGSASAGGGSAAGGSGCYASSDGDFVCPQTGSSSPSQGGTTAGGGGTSTGGGGTTAGGGTSTGGGGSTTAGGGSATSGGSKPGIGSSLQPSTSGSGASNPTPSGPVTSNNGASAYTWPPGFGCSAQNGLSGPPPVGQNPAEWGMTFMEEFNAFDTSMWNDAVWYESPNPTKNYTVEGGALKIWPQRDNSGNFFNRTIDTDGKYYQTYGYFEMEAKLPVGKGTWPAFWLFNHIGDARPEMDVMEAYAGGGPDSGWGDSNLHPVAFAATVWPNGADNGNAGHKTLQTEDLSQAFHTYAVKWEPNKQTYYFDGEPFWELNVTMPDPMYLMLDLWYGSASGQPDDSTPQGINNSYEVNYVRAWEHCGG